LAVTSTLGGAAGVVSVADTEKGEARGGGHRRGPGEVQLRMQTTLTFEQYVTQRGWVRATLATCPLCPPGACRFQRLGTYRRKIPALALVARFYCPERHTTFGLLPDFFASRMPGTLDDIEHAAATAEVSVGVERAAEELRPADAPDAVTLGAAVSWLRRRMAWVRALLVTVAGLRPDLFAGLGGSIGAWRERLGTSRVLVALRGICAPHLHALPRPLGLNPRAQPGFGPGRLRQQSIGPDAPAGAL
jgi:hypothetical protein